MNAMDTNLSVDPPNTPGCVVHRCSISTEKIGGKGAAPVRRVRIAFITVLPILYTTVAVWAWLNELFNSAKPMITTTALMRPVAKIRLCYDGDRMVEE
jgi:hypothetical protein